MTLRDEAEELAIALESGFAKVKDAVDWADAHILRLEQPPYPLIEISTSIATPAAEVVHLLRTLSGEVNTPEVSRRVIARMESAFARGDAGLEKVTRALYQMQLDGCVPDQEAISDMARLDDAFRLAYQGVWGTVEEVDRELRRFFSRYVD